MTSSKRIPLCQFLLLVLGLFVQGMHACVCISSYGLQKSYNEKGKEVLKVRILGEVKTKQRRLYVAKVIKNYSTGIGKSNLIIIGTPTHSCGSYLVKGKWVVTVIKADNGGPSLYNTIACDFNKKWKNLETEELAYLDTRMICNDQGCKCGDGSELYMCLDDPCRVGGEICDTAKCTANYCGGCRAEFTDDIGIVQCQCMAEDPICQGK